MKVVLLAGGLGTRMREQTEILPKPMVDIGGRPVLWHIMKWFAKFGFTDFVILSGYKSERIKEYFANYHLNNFDFTVKLGSPNSLTFFGTHEEENWTVTVLDTGLNTSTGGRIKAAQSLLGEETFICTYGDGIATVPIDRLVEAHDQANRIATVTVTKPTSRFGEILFDAESRVTSFIEKPEFNSWVSIGYFVFSPGIFDVLDSSTPLETAPMANLVSSSNLTAFPHNGFWQPMDTQRELEILKSHWSSGEAPWL